MNSRYILGACTLLVGLLAGGTTAFMQGQQDPQPVNTRQVFLINQEPDAPLPPPGPDKVFFFEGGGPPPKVVKGAPYSAQAVSETTQTLPDGTHIDRKTTSAIYRDADGRTRREQKLGNIGPFASSGDVPEMIFIDDPVAGVKYILDPKTKVAHKVALHTRGMNPPPPPGDPNAPPPPPRGRRGRPDGPIPPNGGPPKDVKTEDLGTQTIEGVQAQGKRTTLTIPAGAIGNDKPLEIVTERWYSPDLQTVVLTRHIDPRFGETDYRLTNITRGDQPLSLFQVPADYTIKEGRNVMFRIGPTGGGGPE